MRRAVAALPALIVGALTLGIVWLLGMRDKDSAVVSRQRRLNRDLLNPKQMATAGTPGAYAAVIRHTGRTSGRGYETPVGVERTEGGFTIALVYGSQSDWVRNVLAAGCATIVHQGQTYPVDHPQVLPIEVAAADFPPEAHRWHRLFGVAEVLRLSVCDATHLSTEE